MPESMDWTAIPEQVLVDCCQLVKANSIEGNKKNNISIIYTPASNLKKTGDMAVGQVSFHKDKLVRRFHVAERQNDIVNRLNKTKGMSDYIGVLIYYVDDASRIPGMSSNERMHPDSIQLSDKSTTRETG
jgi:hypothetical protein